MSDKTGIEWTDATWNPLRGCSRVSEGCRLCYAETVANRFKGEGQPYEGLIAHGGQWNGVIKLVPQLLDQPLRWRRPRRIFVNSMSDLFHENVPEPYIDTVFSVMALAPQHTFQILTKRPGRMRDYFMGLQRAAQIHAEKIGSTFTPADVLNLRYIARHPHAARAIAAAKSVWPLPNVWLGVSVEDQATADARIPLLLATPASVRWISAEPLLGPITFEGLFANEHDPRDGTNALEQLDWVVVGGESGKNARPMHPEWARTLRDQCGVIGTAFLFKQWGEWAPRGPESRGYPLIEGVPQLRLTDDGQNGQALASVGSNHVWMQRAGKKATGRLLDGIRHDEYPQGPA